MYIAHRVKILTILAGSSIYSIADVGCNNNALARSSTRYRYIRLFPLDPGMSISSIARFQPFSYFGKNNLAPALDKYSKETDSPSDSSTLGLVGYGVGRFPTPYATFQLVV